MLVLCLAISDKGVDISSGQLIRGRLTSQTRAGPHFIANLLSYTLRKGMRYDALLSPFLAYLNIKWLWQQFNRKLKTRYWSQRINFYIELHEFCFTRFKDLTYRQPECLRNVFCLSGTRVFASLLRMPSSSTTTISEALSNSFQSSFQNSLMLLVRYGFRTYVQPSQKKTYVLEMHSQPPRLFKSEALQLCFES